MSRTLFFVGLLAALCSGCSSDAPSNGGSAGTGNTSCLDLHGQWTIANHCRKEFIDTTVEITQQGCTLSFAEPFDGYSGNVTEDGKLTVSGQQSCNGAALEDAILMLCGADPDPCLVELQR